MLNPGSRLRHLFAEILHHCKPVSPEALWRDFRSGICDDLRHRLAVLGHQQVSEDDVYDYGLFLLDKALRQFGSSLSDFETMPRPHRNWAATVENAYISEQLDYDIQHERQQAEERIPQLNRDQRSAFEHIVDSVSAHSGRLFFLNGPGGTGKTFLYNTVCNKVSDSDLIYSTEQQH